MNVSVSGSVSSIEDVTIATTGKGEPNWSYIPSAGAELSELQTIWRRSPHLIGKHK